MARLPARRPKNAAWQRTHVGGMDGDYCWRTGKPCGPARARRSARTHEAPVIKAKRECDEWIAANELPAPSIHRMIDDNARLLALSLLSLRYTPQNDEQRAKLTRLAGIRCSQTTLLFCNNDHFKNIDDDDNDEWQLQEQEQRTQHTVLSAIHELFSGFYLISEHDNIMLQTRRCWSGYKSGTKRVNSCNAIFDNSRENVKCVGRTMLDIISSRRFSIQNLIRQSTNRWRSRTPIWNRSAPLIIQTLSPAIVRRHLTNVILSAKSKYSVDCIVVKPHKNVVATQYKSSYT